MYICNSCFCRIGGRETTFCRRNHTIYRTLRSLLRMYGRSLLYFSLHSPHVTARRAGHLLLPILIATVCGSSCRRRNLYAKTTTPRMLLSIHSLHISLHISHSYVIRVRSPLSQTSSAITSRSRSQRIHHNRHRSYNSLTNHTMFSLSLSLSHTHSKARIESHII